MTYDYSYLYFKQFIALLIYIKEQMTYTQNMKLQLALVQLNLVFVLQFTWHSTDKPFLRMHISKEPARVLCRGNKKIGLHLYSKIQSFSSLMEC